MANLFYDPINGGVDMQVYKDPQVITRASFEEAVSDLQDLQLVPDSLREDLAKSGLTVGNGLITFPAFTSPDPDDPSLSPLELLDREVSNELDRVRDILDYFDYEAGPANLTVRTEAWQTPVAVESVSHENAGEEATKSIDGDFGADAWWQSDLPGERKLVWRHRDYNKRIVGLRLRTTAGDARTWLRGATFSVSGALANIDNPDRIASANVDFDHDGDAWMEHIFASPMTGRYLQLAVSTSDFGDEIRVREIEVRVGTLNHDK